MGLRNKVYNSYEKSIEIKDNVEQDIMWMKLWLENQPLKQRLKLGTLGFIFLVNILVNILTIPLVIAAVPIQNNSLATVSSVTRVTPPATSSASLAIAKQYGKYFETKDITSLLPLLDKQTLVIFNIDNTIFRTKTLFGSPEWAMHLIHQEMNKGNSREMSAKKCYPIWMKAQKYADVVLLDKKILTVLKEVQKKTCGFIGLTSRHPSAAEITQWQLNKFGIDFARSRFSLYSFISSYKHPTLFRQGILFSNESNQKGEVFAAWMEQIRTQINQKNMVKKIIVIDDKERNLQSMAKAAEYLGLEFVGLRYSAIEAYPKKINPELVEKEKEILTNNFSDSETWLFLENAGSYKGGEWIVEHDEHSG